jgi:O-antigen ligase
MLATGMVALWRLPFSRALKATLLGMVLLAGLAGFFLKHAGFFEKGATSVGARFDYWEAALKTVQANPVFGTGPGTFFIPYQKIKRPESEPARLVHNDYLEQASDSGLPGFLAYATFMIAALVFSFPRGASPCSEQSSMDWAQCGKNVWKLTQTDEWLRFSIWLGVLGFSLQGLMEFGLYIPALAWPAFALLGWLLANSRNAFDMHRGSS